MLNKLKTIFLLIISIVSLNSCKKNNAFVDKESISATAVEFLFKKNVVNYSVSSLEIPISIPVAITSVANNDRIVSVSYSSPTGALLGTHFNAPSTITFKGSKLFDTIKITGIYSQYASGRKDSIKVKIGGYDIKGLFGSDSVWVILQKYCDVVLANLEGDYPQAAEYQANANGSYPAVETYGFPSRPYTAPATISVLTPTSATTATGKFGNLYDNGWAEIDFTMDWTDPANFKINIDLQDTGDPDLQVRTSVPNQSTFSSCDRTITLICDLVDPVTGNIKTGLGKYKFILK